jgi:MFS family permease
VLDQRRSAVAVAVIFVANGLVVGTFGGSLPGFRTLLGLGDGHIVGVLVTAGLFAVASMQVSGRVADRVGARVPTFVGGGLMVLATGVLGSAQGYLWLLAGAAVFGLGNGVMDVAMNAIGVVVEEARGGPIMSRFHAFFSIGNLCGAGIVVVLGPVQARLPVLVGGALLVLLLVVVRPITPQTPPVEQHEDGPARIPRLAWLLAAMAVCFGITEGTAIDWSSIHVTDVTGVSASQGAWGLAAVSGFMVVIRLFGDLAVARFGRRAVVAGGASCAMAGYLLAATVSAIGPVLFGWCLVGFGVGLIAPQIYGLAGRIGGGRVLALVVSFGYTAFLVGPAVIGLIAVQTDTATRPGIQNAMLLPLVSALGLIVMSTRLPARDPDGVARTSTGIAD